MLTGVSLAEARRVVEFSNEGDYRTSSSALRVALADSGVRMGRKVGSSSWDSLRRRPVRAIAAVRSHTTRGGNARWHWTLFDGLDRTPRLLDPERGVRTDFGRVKLSWYHLIRHDGS